MMMTNPNELKRIAEQLIAMKKFTTLLGVQTGKSQGALLKGLTADETAQVAKIALEMMTDDPA
jgi:hypothetical protein